ncbi:Electron-transferring-flavoproteindehydrogenase [Thermodesulfobium narugense DSM 14796]|uniref:Electron-transferring-flavoproteindehydrogenase n=1 Tax=Thermodesulfobium narugense DSM 14796 TaxID=747365 RepID=M1E469_9BACT|nr:FAD-dependent oxidoreductase [Thermodesulfobium narugense]AEE13757.1 Electron-transferring-flavoproteindehydrogenase [Thermodesulfobium narugense DSM 14796]
MRKNDFDVIIVGAGPAGLAAGYVLAKEGINVAIIERGIFPGSKNVMGGIFYRSSLDDLIPDFYKEAPLERHIIEQKVWFLSDDSMFSAGLKSERYNVEPYNCFSVFRAKFDKWFAKKVSDASAMIINETVVRELILKRGKVVGVRTDRPNGDLYCDVVISAEGVNSFLPKSLGLRKKINANNVALGVKEVIELPDKVINDRFGVSNSSEGVTIEITGPYFNEMRAMGFVYTNRNSLSVGIGAVIEDLVRLKMNPNDLLETLKSHPAIKPLVSGGETKEYMAHMIPEGGYYSMPKLYHDGFMVVGDAAMLVNSIHREGANLAIESGKLAAKTYIEARKKGDFSQRALSAYQKRLEESFVLKDLKTYKNLPKLLEEKKYLISKYPKFLIDAMYEIYNVDRVPKSEKIKLILNKAKKEIGYFSIIKDIFSVWRNLR